MKIKQAVKFVILVAFLHLQLGSSQNYEEHMDNDLDVNEKSGKDLAQHSPGDRPKHRRPHNMQRVPYKGYDWHNDSFMPKYLWELDEQYQR